VKTLLNQKGIAMLVALSAVLILTFIAVEVGYNTQVELAIGVASVERLQAYYLAKAGVNLSLLRIKIFKLASQKAGSSLGKDTDLLELVWKVPFMWPPQAFGDLGSVEKAEFKKTISESLLQGDITATIESESSRIDLTDLISPSKAIKEATQKQLVSLLETRLEQDDEWARENRGNLKPTELINNISDWMSQDPNSLNGGDKQAGYTPPLKTSNRPLKTLAELHMVKGMTDDIFNILINRVTLYGTKSVNVNKAPKEILKSLDSQISDKVAEAIITRREDPDQGPFASQDEFLKFLQNQGVNTQNFNKAPGIPLAFEPDPNFRINSIGIKGKSQREIFAITFDFDKVKEKLVSALPEPTPTSTPSPTPASAKPNATATPSPTPTPSPATPQSLPSGPPSVVYWQET
jgi:general secretion pathway protein K